MPGEDAPSAEVFNDVFTQISRAPRVSELFHQILGPFPAGVEPFSLVPRHGLDRVLAELRLGPGDHLLDLCCGRGGIGLWFASVSGARLTGADFSAAAIGQASRRAAGFAPRPRAFYERVIAEDSDQAEPAVRLLASEGRALLPYSASVRRLLLVASA